MDPLQEFEGAGLIGYRPLRVVLSYNCGAVTEDVRGVLDASAFHQDLCCESMAESMGTRPFNAALPEDLCSAIGVCAMESIVWNYAARTLRNDT